MSIWLWTKRLNQTLKTIVLLITLLASLMMVMLAKHTYDNLMEIKTLQTQIVQKQQKYVAAIKLLSQEKWREASRILNELQGYKDTLELDAYAKARLFWLQADYRQALSELKKIPGNFQGPFKDQINSLRLLLDGQPAQWYSKAYSPWATGKLEPLKDKVLLKAQLLQDGLP